MNDPRLIASEFFGLFGDFEFALKRAGVLKKGANAFADWTAYSTMLGPTFFEDVRTQNIAPTLIAEPPRKLRAKGLEWLPDVPDQIGDVRGLIVQGVCGVRNNYAHGEKLRGESEAVLTRDIALLSEALAILKAAKGRVPDVDVYL